MLYKVSLEGVLYNGAEEGSFLNLAALGKIISLKGKKAEGAIQPIVKYRDWDKILGVKVYPYFIYYFCPSRKQE